MGLVETFVATADIEVVLDKEGASLPMVESPTVVLFSQMKLRDLISMVEKVV